MKKIVGIIAAVAMAASVFAVDLAASLKFENDLFNIEFKDNAKPNVFTLGQPKARVGHGQTGFNLSVSTEKAGATIEIGNGYGGTLALEYQDFTLWVQPIDQLKITFGKIDNCINKETIDYAGSINSISGAGFTFDVMPIEGLTLTGIMNPGYGNAWISDKSAIAGTAFYAKYKISDDAGTVGASWTYNNEINVANPVYVNLYGDDSKPWEDPYYKFTGADYNRFSLGYNNTFGDISMFADVAFGIISDDVKAKTFDTSAFDLLVDGFIKYNKDSFGIAAYLCYTNWLGITHLANKTKTDDVFGYCNDLTAWLKMTYQIDAVGIYLYAKVADVMLDEDERVNITINPGVTFNVGAAAFDIGVKFENIGQDKDKGEKPVKLTVPVKVSIGL